MMQSTSDFLSSLHRRGIRVWSDAGQLRFQAPKGVFLLDEIEKLRALKPQIIDLLARSEVTIHGPIEAREPGCLIPLTAVQLGFWLKYLKPSGGLSKRMCSIAVRIQGPLDEGLLHGCLDTVVHRHESMRTRFVEIGGVMSQQIDAARSLPLERIDLARIPSVKMDAEVSLLAHELVEEEVDLSAGPLVKAQLFCMSAHEHVLLLALDHLITDGVSKALLNGEVWTLYNQGVAGEQLTLLTPRLQFGDFAVWDQKMRPTWRRNHDAYWSSRLAKAQCVKLPRTAGLTEAEVPVGAMMQMGFGDSLSAQLRETAKRERTLLSLVVLSLYVIVIARWCNKRDMLLLTVLNGRDRPELESMLGYLANPVYLRVEISEDDTFLEVLKRVILEFSTAYEHQETAVEYIADYETEMVFNWRPANHPQWLVGSKPDSSHRVSVQPFPFRPLRVSTFAPLFAETHTGIEVTVMYRPDILARSSIERFGQELCQLAKEFTDHPSTRVASIPMTTL